MEILPLVVSAALAALLAPGALRAFAEAGRVRENHRGLLLPFPAGAVAVCAGLIALGLLALAERVFDTSVLVQSPPGVSQGWTPYAPLDNTVVVFGALDRVGILVGNLQLDPMRWLPLWLGVAFLGLLDDVLDLGARGWRGLLRAVAGRAFSTGATKAVGTAALAFFVMARTPQSLGHAVLSAVVIALATNLFNLLDLRPGRAVKAWVLLAAVLLVAEWDAEPLRLVGPFAGALLVLGAYDLRERCMLGDTGASLLGALAGTWLVVSLGTTGEAVAAAVLLALTIFGEFASFSRAIDRMPPVRGLDSLGRRTDA